VSLTGRYPCRRGRAGAIAALGAFAILAVAADGHAAATIFKCVGANGVVAYQATRCETPQQQSEVAVRPAPPVPPPSETNADAPPPSPAAATVPASRVAPVPPPPVAVSYECRAGDGTTFYTHGHCPPEIRPRNQVATATVRGVPDVQVPLYTKVSETEVTREYACAQINARSASDRDGHEFDERVSTYDKNLGRDKCFP
jgi:hypothetical protein